VGHTLAIGSFGEVDKVAEVAITCGIRFMGVSQAIRRELADCLQQSVAMLFGEDERLVHKLRQQIEHRIALDIVALDKLLGGVEGPSASEDGQTTQTARSGSARSA
jgi:hypothetical protein